LKVVQDSQFIDFKPHPDTLSYDNNLRKVDEERLDALMEKMKEKKIAIPDKLFKAIAAERSCKDFRLLIDLQWLIEDDPRYEDLGKKVLQ